MLRASVRRLFSQPIRQTVYLRECLDTTAFPYTLRLYSTQTAVKDKPGTAVSEKEAEETRIGIRRPLENVPFIRELFLGRFAKVNAKKVSFYIYTFWIIPELYDIHVYYRSALEFKWCLLNSMKQFQDFSFEMPLYPNRFQQLKIKSLWGYLIANNLKVPRMITKNVQTVLRTRCQQFPL